MMYIEIHNSYARVAMVLLCMTGSNGGIREETKTHGAFWLSMMPWRSGCTERVGRLTSDHEINRLDRRTRREHSRR